MLVGGVVASRGDFSFWGAEPPVAVTGCLAGGVVVAVKDSVVGVAARFDVSTGSVAGAASEAGKSAAVQEANAAVSKATDRYRRRFIYSVRSGYKPGVAGGWVVINSFVLSP